MLEELCVLRVRRTEAIPALCRGLGLGLFDEGLSVDSV